MVIKLVQLLSLVLILAGQRAQAHADAPLSDEMLGPVRYLVATLKTPHYHMTLLDLRAKDLEILGVDYNNSMIDLLLSQEEYLHLIDSGYDLVIDDSKNILMRPDQEYKTPGEIETFVKEVSERFPESAKLVEIGRSLENRPIYALRLGTGDEQEIQTRPSILFNSMHHAREVMTPEVAIDIVEYLLENPLADARVQAWLAQYQIWVVPMLNVDGNNRVWSGDSMWRKNVRGGYGVDINRNYPYKWGSCNGSSTSRWSDTFRGDSAGSEPETKVLMNLVSSVRPVFNISFHSFSEMVLYPFGCQGQKTPQHQMIASLGEQMAKAINYVHGTPWEILYGVDGGDIDWMYAEQQVIPYVIEVSSRSEGFQPSYAQWRQKTVERVRPAWIRILNRMEENAVKGQVNISDQRQLGNLTIQLRSLKGGEFTVRPTAKGRYFIPALSGDYKLELKEAKTVLQVHDVKLEGSNVVIDFNI